MFYISQNRRALRVLLVEDSPTDARLVTELLRKSTSTIFVINHAESLSSATESVLMGEVDIVLLDLGLPDTSGVNTVREFVEACPYPIIVVTSSDDYETTHDVFRLGVQDMIIKGDISLPVLEHSIISAVERYGAEQLRKKTITELIDANLDQARVARELARLNHTLANEVRSREMAQKAFEVSEARFRSIFEESPVPLWEMDLSRVKSVLDDLNNRRKDLENYFKVHGGEIVRLVAMIDTIDISNATLRLFKAKTKEEMIERFPATLTPHAFRRMALAFSALARGAAHYEAETVFTSLDDHDIELLIRWSVVPGHERTLSRVLLSTVNITKIKQSERQRRLLSTAIEQSVETVIVTDENGVIQYANPAFERSSGYTRLEAVAHKRTLLQNLPGKERINENILSTLMKGTVWSGRLHGISKDGVALEEEATISPIFDETGKITNFVAVKRDVTREAGLERQLRQSQKLEAIGQLAAGIAHEINTPIQYVGDNIKFLSEAFEAYSRLAKTTNTLREHLLGATTLESAKALCTSLDKEIEGSDLEFYEEEVPLAISQSLDGGKRISSIVAAMKEFAHPGTELKSSHDLGAAIQSTITVARNEWKYVANVETDFDQKLPLVPCYVGELNQVFLNMIVNAAHAIEARQDRKGEKGLISISTRLDGDFVEIIIRDTGMGIPNEIRDRVFDPFFTTKGVGKGSGQGLAIAYSTVVDKHNGQILLESEVGVGTAFTIRIPVLDTADIDSNGQGEAF